MNKYYTASVPYDLAQALKEKGMPIETEGENIWCPSYAECFDWLMDHRIDAEVYLSITRTECGRITEKIYAWVVSSLKGEHDSGEEDSMSWYEAAITAINKALELL